MKKKLASIIVCMLLCVTAASAVAVNINNDIKTSEDGSVDLSHVADDDWWWMYQHDPQHTGYSTSVAPNTARIRWDYYGLSTSSCPAVVDDKIYVGAQNGVYCLNVSDGELFWIFGFGSGWNFGTSGPAVYDGRLYVGAGKTSVGGRVYCLDLTGSEIWNFTSDKTLAGSSPAVVDDRVYICESYPGKKVYCFDADPSDGVDEGFDDPDGSNYDLIWVYEVGGALYFPSPAVVDDRVFVGATDKKVYCLNATGNGDGTTSLVWSYTANGQIYSGASVAEGKVFVGASDGYLYCLNASDAASTRLLWKFNTGQPITWSTPSVAYGYVYVGHAQGVVCLTVGGTSKWSNNAGGAVGNVAVADGKAYFYSIDADRTLWCRNATTGQPVWDLTEAGAMNPAFPAIADGKLYHSSFAVYCFEDNLPPDTPTIDGPSAGLYEEEITFTIHSTDPNDDDLIFSVDWGDGEDDEYESLSGVSLEISHTWEEPDEYTIEVEVEDEFGLPADESVLHEITITDLFELGDIKGGFGKVCVDIHSLAVIDIDDISWSISAKGGIFGLINVSGNGSIDILAPDETVEVCTDGFIFGLGNINILVSANSPGRDPVTKNATALVIGPFIINISEEEPALHNLLLSIG